jgi:hypothetical protein
LRSACAPSGSSSLTTKGRILAELYELGAPIDERLDTAEGVIVLAQLPQREVPRFAPYLVAEPAARARGR